MHEQSLIRALLRQVEQIRIENGGLAVVDIQVEIGPLAGVEPLLLESAYKVVSPEFRMRETHLVVNEVPLTAECPACGTIAVEQTRIVCPQCGQTEVTITAGDEMRLVSVTLQTADERDRPA
ncbi:MAG: hydrogenase maturation nickel metallochaperone HypA [Planctomycetes bacterium]|nr:hydrogenase maturation nickel metallochaperone HypA [Planctomycetota bacterium]